MNSIFFSRVFRSCEFVCRIAIIIAIVAAAVYFPSRFLWNTIYSYSTRTITHVDVHTNGITTASFLAEKHWIPSDSKLFAFDSRDLSAKLSSLPWVQSATVNANSDGSLLITLCERQAVAWIDAPQFDLPARIPQKSLLVDQDGYVFVCQPAHLANALNLPTIRIPDNFISTPPKDGSPISHPTLLAAIQMIHANAELAIPNLPPILVITPRNDWSLTASLGDNSSAIFGLSDISRQLRDLSVIFNHAEKTRRQIDSVNLIPSRNIPVVFRDKNSAPPPAAIVVDESQPATPDAAPAPSPAQPSTQTRATSSQPAPTPAAAPSSPARASAQSAAPSSPKSSTRPATQNSSSSRASNSRTSTSRASRNSTSRASRNSTSPAPASSSSSSRTASSSRTSSSRTAASSSRTSSRTSSRNSSAQTPRRASSPPATASSASRRSSSSSRPPRAIPVNESEPARPPRAIPVDE